MPLRSPDALGRLVEEVRHGDVSAFEQLFRSLHAPLCDVVDSYVRSQAVAEEIVQDLFFVLWMRRESWPVMESPLGYLSAAARNRALHHLERQAVARRWSESAGDDGEGTMSTAAAAPDRALESREAAAAVRRAIDGLPARGRLAVVLRWEHGMSYAEVASVMGISIKGVEKLITNAKRRLRIALGDFAPDYIARPGD